MANNTVGMLFNVLQELPNLLAAGKDVVQLIESTLATVRVAQSQSRDPTAAEWNGIHTQIDALTSQLDRPEEPVVVTAARTSPAQATLASEAPFSGSSSAAYTFPGDGSSSAMYTATDTALRDRSLSSNTTPDRSLSSNTLSSNTPPDYSLSGVGDERSPVTRTSASETFTDGSLLRPSTADEDKAEFDAAEAKARLDLADYQAKAKRDKEL